MKLSEEALAELHALTDRPVSLLTYRAGGQLSLNSAPGTRLPEGPLRRELDTWYTSQRPPRDHYLTTTFRKGVPCVPSTPLP